jgi:hypothetical protein
MISMAKDSVQSWKGYINSSSFAWQIVLANHPIRLVTTWYEHQTTLFNPVEPREMRTGQPKTRAFQPL